MITRRHARRALVWAAAGLGAVGLLAYALSLFVVISYDAGDRLVTFGRGAVTVRWAIFRPPIFTGTPPTMAPPPPPAGLQASGNSGGPWRWLPHWTNPGGQSGQAAGLFAVPYWILLVIGAVGGYYLLPIGYGAGRCQRCGYDLGAVPRPAEGPFRCPECGAAAGVGT